MPFSTLPNHVRFPIPFPSRIARQPGKSCGGGCHLQRFHTEEGKGSNAQPTAQAASGMAPAQEGKAAPSPGLDASLGLSMAWHQILKQILQQQSLLDCTQCSILSHQRDQERAEKDQKTGDQENSARWHVLNHEDNQCWSS